MYDYLRGTLTYQAPDIAVIDVQGIGYKLHISLTAHLQGPEVTLFTSLVVREDDMRLFGFPTREERDLFELLMTVSGIGPKTALLITSHLPLPDLHDAIERKDIATLSRIPGIGKKTGERLCLELKDKLRVTAPKNPLAFDATSALIRLGYNQKSAAQAIQKALPHATTLQQLITLSLKELS